ncbi:MAG: V-type ATPase subunit [Candidatus Thermoplasmatota archaeon]|nr:V-type ATPase subunit [Candidatus Thermoplasmatota archaeon]
MFEEVLNPQSPFFWLLLISILAAVFLFIGRYFRTYVKFVYPNAKFEAIGNPFIQEKELNILVENTTLETFKDRLNTLRDYQVDGDNASLIQQSLDTNFLRTVAMMRKDSSKKLYAFFDLYLQKNDFPLIKNEIKTILLGMERHPLVERAAHPQTKKLLEQLQGVSKEQLSSVLAAQGFTKDLQDEVSKETPDFFQIDLLFEKAFLAQFKALKVPYKCENAKEDFIKNMVDMLTIQHLLRAKQLSYPPDRGKSLFLGEGKQISRWRFDAMIDASDVPGLITALDGTSYFPLLSTKIEHYSKQKSVSMFETLIQSVFLLRVKQISLQNYLTIGPLLRFLVSKEFEIKNLKVIAKGIAENLPTELIKSNLVKEVAA